MRELFKLNELNRTRYMYVNSPVEFYDTVRTTFTCFHSLAFIDECCHLHVEVGNFSDQSRNYQIRDISLRSSVKSILWLHISVSMVSVEFRKIYRIFLISSVSELFGNSSRINFFRVDLLCVLKYPEEVFLSENAWITVERILVIEEMNK